MCKVVPVVGGVCERWADKVAEYVAVQKMGVGTLFLKKLVTLHRLFASSLMSTGDVNEIVANFHSRWKTTSGQSGACVPHLWVSYGGM